MSKPVTFLLTESFNETERGNTWLVRDGDHVVWIRLAGDFRLEISVTPGNYPGVDVQTTLISDKALVTHILLNCQGWTIRKLNLEDPRLEDIGTEVPLIDEPDEPERTECTE